MNVRASFAGLHLDLAGLHAAVVDVVAARFAAPASSAAAPTADAALRFRTVERTSFPPHTGLVEEWCHITGEGGARLSFSARLARGRFDGVSADVDLADVPVLDAVNAVENVLRLVTAQIVAARGGLLLHSAAIADADGTAIVLVGRSGAGKSTASGTARRLGRRVLSDELNAVFVRGGAAVVHPVPFAGDFGEAPAHRALPVRGLYLLERGADAVRPVTRARAAAALFASAPFVNGNPDRADALFDNVLALAASCRAQALHLSLGADAWRVAAEAA